MYSQQEYDMMRRQTLQIEAEKRSLLRTLLTGVAVALTITLILLGYLFRRYSQSNTLISSAENKAAAAEAQFQTCSTELQEKRGILDAQAKRAEQRTEAISRLIPRVMSKTASDVEIGQFANAVYELPSHSVVLPSIPPDSLLRRYRHRSGNQVSAYILVAGIVDGKWTLYSNLVAKGQSE
jgi:hypothetical protein